MTTTTTQHNTRTTAKRPERPYIAMDEAEPCGFCERVTVEERDHAKDCPRRQVKGGAR